MRITFLKTMYAAFLFYLALQTYKDGDHQIRDNIRNAITYYKQNYNLSFIQGFLPSNLEEYADKIRYSLVFVSVQSAFLLIMNFRQGAILAALNGVLIMLFTHNTWTPKTGKATYADTRLLTQSIAQIVIAIILYVNMKNQEDRERLLFQAKEGIQALARSKEKIKTK